MSDDVQIYGPAIGRRLDADRPENHLADLDSHRLATKERVEHARLYWPERKPEEFSRYGSTDRKFVDSSGDVFVVVGHDPFQQEHPEADSIECFVVNGGWIFYLKRRFSHRVGSAPRGVLADIRTAEHGGAGATTSPSTPGRLFVAPSVLPVCGPTLQLSRLTCRYPYHRSIEL